MTTEPSLEPLDRLAGTWTTEASHPALPGVVVRGTATVEWLEGERFLIHRARNEHPDFPDSISVIGFTERDRIDDAARRDRSAEAAPTLTMHYFDSRGVFRIYQASVDEQAWRLWRDAPGFSQRFTGAFAEGGDTVVGMWETRPDDVHWEEDLRITYRRGRR